MWTFYINWFNQTFLKIYWFVAIIPMTNFNIVLQYTCSDEIFIIVGLNTQYFWQTRHFKHEQLKLSCKPKRKQKGKRIIRTKYIYNSKLKQKR